MNRWLQGFSELEAARAVPGQRKRREQHELLAARAVGYGATRAARVGICGSSARRRLLELLETVATRPARDRGRKISMRRPDLDAVRQHMMKATDEPRSAAAGSARAIVSGAATTALVGGYGSSSRRKLREPLERGCGKNS